MGTIVDENNKKEKGIKIFFFINNIPPDYGGGYLRVLKIASRFKKSGWLYRIGTFTKAARYTEGIQGIKSEDIFFYGNKLLSSFFVVPYQLIKNSSKYDVFYVASTHWYTVIPSLIARLLRKRVVLGVTLSMIDSPASRPNGIIKMPYYWFKNVQFKFANYIFVNSPLLVEECKTCGYEVEVVKLINNPVDTLKYFPVSRVEKERLRIQNNLVSKWFTILFVGSFNRRKGCDILPEIFEKLYSKYKINLNLIMCGQKGYPETEGILSSLNRVFEKTGNRLIILEEVKDTAPYYQMADLFLFPTTNEGMPNVILEAMASKCMILCNHLPGITDYTLDESFLVENNDINNYVERIANFYTSHDLYEDEINSNIELIKREFSIDSVDGYIKKLLIQ